MQEMVIYGVSFDMVGKQPIVLLKTVESNKFLPIWIGHPEAAAILMKLQGASTPRPMTHDLMRDILAELDREEEGVITATLDLDRVKRHRAAFGFFRDRRPELLEHLRELGVDRERLWRKEPILVGKQALGWGGRAHGGDTIVSGDHWADREKKHPTPNTQHPTSNIQ